MKKFSGIILSIGDGDTLRADFGTQKATVRLACIDAPEMRQQPWGERSRNRLRELLPVGETAIFAIKGKDIYRRFIAEIFYQNQYINLLMIQEGNAVVYRQYLSPCSANRRDLLEAEKLAREEMRGFWNQPYPLMPWNFRRLMKLGRMR